MKRIYSILIRSGIIFLPILFFINFSYAPAPGCENRQQPDNTDLNRTITNDLSNEPSLYGLDERIRRYMRKWNIKGASLSIMRNDSLVYSKGYGWADKENDLLMEPGNVMRIASVSKLITAVGIMVLREEGKLSLNDTVFGPRGILDDSTYTSVIKDKNYYKITVEELLRHEAGFTRRYGDPMFSTRYVIMQNHLDGAPDHNTLLRCVLKKPLSYVPGTSRYYSNFGYLLLSMIIEKISGTDYESFIQENVLHKAGCSDMQIAGNCYCDKYENEVKYYMQPDDEAVYKYDNSGEKVARCYGGNDITALSGAGAWVASTPELARFIASIDGKPETPDIINAESIHEMTRWIDKKTYALGWIDTKPDGEWTRTGTLSGTSALVKYYPDGECWIMVTNTSTWKGPLQTHYTSSLFNSSRALYSALLPKKNLFSAE